MKIITKLIPTVLLAFFSAQVSASVELEELSSCMTDSLNGQERKNLIKWVYVGLSTHSSLKGLSNVTVRDIDDSNQYVGKLIHRLISIDCESEVKKAEFMGNYDSFSHAFYVVGEVAMEEIMLEPKTREALQGFSNYLGEVRE